MDFCSVDFALKLNLVGLFCCCFLCCLPCFDHSQVFCSSLGVMLAVDTIIAELKKLSKPVTTPEEIAQVRKQLNQLYIAVL